MNRHFRVARLASGVLFSPPADPDEEPDVWIPQRKKRKQQFDQDSAEYGTASEYASSSTHTMSDADYASSHRSKYSVFPSFIDMTPMKRFTQHPPSDNDIELSDPSHPRTKSPVTLCLSILRVSVHVSIDGTISHTKLTQSFHNPSEIDIPEARHTFPLYHGAVITSFECKIGDSRRLRGVVKPTAQARREFEEAKEKKREASALLEELTPEIFETSLGNIPAKTTVEINLTYVHELKVVTSKEEKSEGLAVIIPTSIAPRYADAVTPSPLPAAHYDQLEITIGVLDNGSINAAASHVESNHPSTTYQGLQPCNDLIVANIAELRHLNSATSSEPELQHLWKHASNSQPTLQGDFIFVIQMLEEARLQSHAVITPANDMGHAALMVSLRPNDLFGSAVRPEMFKGEILFLLDRSSSMGWTRRGTNRRKIETMRNAMSLALSGLPSTCRFNIISFGSEVRGMWPESRRADNPEDLSYAKEYVANVQANMKGTKVLLALKGAVNNCEPSCSSTQIILITDGEVNREPHDSILKHVWETRKIYGEKIRFFTLGIGDCVSHSVMESIAELGGGYCDVVDVAKNPRWEGCLNRMLRSVMEPDAWTCEIDLGPGYQRQSLVESRFGTRDEGGTDLVHYAQGPQPIPSLQPFRYKSFFFLLDLRDAKPPTTVTVRTTSEQAKKKVYSMDIKMAQLREGTIHPLAVRTILRSLGDEVKRTGVSEEQARLNAEYLGAKYAIASNWTSFVAVVDGTLEKACQIDTYKSRFKEADIEELLVSKREKSSILTWMASGGIKRIKGQGASIVLEKGNEQMPSMTREICRENEKTDVNDDKAYPSDFRIDSLVALSEPSTAQDYTALNHANVVHNYEAPSTTKEEPLPGEMTSEQSFYGLNPDRDQLSNSVSKASKKSRHLRPRFQKTTPAHYHGPDTEGGQFDPRGSPQTGKNDYDRVPESIPLPASFEIMPNEAIRTQESLPMISSTDETRQHDRTEPALLYDLDYLDLDDSLTKASVEPSGNLPISWQDAVNCENGGLFILPVAFRESLRQHFCDITFEHLQKTLRNSLGAKVAEDEATVLIDTLMMIQYFKTHLAAEEVYWSLMMDKAERALLLSLGYGEDQEEALEPLHNKLLSAMLHVHFSESLKHASVYQEEADKSHASSAFETCIVCDTTIEANDKKQRIIDKGYTCLADECYDIKTQRRKTYTSWKMFWDHQVQSGHLLCP